MKLTDKDLFACERQAHLYYEQNKEQVIKNAIADRNAQTRLEEQLRKERLNERFWRNVWVSANTLGLMIIIYTLFHFM